MLSFIEPKRLKKLERRINYVKLVDPNGNELPHLHLKYVRALGDRRIYNNMLRILNTAWMDTMLPDMFDHIYLIGIQWNPSELQWSSDAVKYDKSRDMPDIYITRTIHARDTSALICEWHGYTHRKIFLHAYIKGTQLCLCRNAALDKRQALEIINIIQPYLPIKGILGIMLEYITVSEFIDVRI